MRVALKERENRSERKRYKEPARDSRDGARGSTALSERRTLILNTQGSAKPPPWAESCNRFAVNPTGSQALADARRHKGE
jgi:hypothetical protein